MNKRIISASLISLTVLGGCRIMGTPASAKKDAQVFIDGYTTKFMELQYASALAEWNSNTHIVEGDETNSKQTQAANEKLAEFTGDVHNIDTARYWQSDAGYLDPVQALQIDRILFMAADKPQTVPKLVTERIAAEAAQTEKLYGYTFKIDGKEVTPNEINKILTTETDLTKRQKAWEASKAIGSTLKEGLNTLRNLRNQTVRSLGYSDYFTYQVSEYGMTTPEMIAMMEQFNREVRPLYRELHTYFRYELAKKYNQPVPDMIPAHWLPNRWSQDWTDLVDVKGLDLNAALKDKSPDWLVKQAESFYVSLGFPNLPASFYEKSSLYPVAKEAGFKKNTHASAWHLDLDHDIRSLMSVESNSEWYETTHHELGHIYYYLTYTNPDVPALLRGGANRAYHEAMGSLMGLAAMQPAFVQGIGLLPKDQKADEMQTLLKEALNYIVFIPWSAGTMTQFEYQLYNKELSPKQWNKKWWELVKKYQGVVPPTERGEEFCDAATKTHINDDPAQYYDYAISYVLLMQLHDHIAKQILHEDPHNTNYFGHKEVGDFTRSLMYPGASVDWRKLFREKVGDDLSANPMLFYFEPLMKWLQEQNKGRQHTLGDV